MDYGLALITDRALNNGKMDILPCPLMTWRYRNVKRIWLLAHSAGRYGFWMISAHCVQRQKKNLIIIKKYLSFNPKMPTRPNTVLQQATTGAIMDYIMARTAPAVQQFLILFTRH